MTWFWIVFGESPFSFSPFRARPPLTLRDHVADHVVGLDPVDRLPAEVGDEVALEHDPVVLDRGGGALRDVLEVVQVSVAGPLHRHAVVPRDHDRLLLDSALQLPLRLRPGQALAGTGLANRPERRFTSRPATRHWPYQLPCLTKSEPVRCERRATPGSSRILSATATRTRCAFRRLRRIPSASRLSSVRADMDGRLELL